jgi:uncharacterized membrane-anchored protein
MSYSLRRWLVVLAVAFQVVAVAAIAVHKEWLLHSGRELVVQTAPIDPRDIFRGDYVRLDYLFSRLPLARIDASLTRGGVRKGQVVYLGMQVDAQGVARADKVYAEPPAGAFLRGYAASDWPFRGFQGSSRAFPDSPAPLQLRYGIEQYYVQQGRGHELERLRGGRNDFQRPMLVRLAVADDGEALIRGHAWSRLGVKTEIVHSPPRDAPPEQSGARLRLTVRNLSDKPLTLMLRPDACSFEMQPVGWAPRDAAPLARREALCATRAAEPRVLAPSRDLVQEIDFNAPEWRLQRQGKLVPLGKLPSNYRYRLVYREPLPQGLKTRIVSRALHARGNVD